MHSRPTLSLEVEDMKITRTLGAFALSALLAGSALANTVAITDSSTMVKAKTPAANGWKSSTTDKAP
jgi:hypothetical protein